MAAGASAGAAAAAAIANAVKASGVVVRVAPEDFLKIAHRAAAPLIVMAEGGFFTSKHRYLTSYKGLAFYTESVDALQLPADAEVIAAEKIWIPG